MFNKEKPEKPLDGQLHSQKLSEAIDKVEDILTKDGESAVLTGLGNQLFDALWVKYQQNIRSPKQGGIGGLLLGFNGGNGDITVTNRRPKPAPAPPEPDDNEDE